MQKLSLKIIALFALVLAIFGQAAPASANVTRLVLGRRTCEGVTAYVLYDSFSAGSPPYLAGFAVDLDGDGLHGEPEALEKSIFTKTGPSGAAGFIRGQLKFPALPEGSVISVTAYEVDSNGRPISAQLPAVTYTCTNRPQTLQIPASAPYIIPNVAVSARVTFSPRIPVFDAPNGKNEIGGLATGESVTAIGRNSRGDWLQIAFGGGTAWMMWNTNALVFGPYKSLPVTAK